MKLIYIHLNPLAFDFSNELNISKYVFSDIPEYAQVSIEQSKSLNYEVIVVTNIKKYKAEINNFFNLCKTGFPSFYKDPFWLLTLLRLYVLYLYVEENNIEEFIHMEYDNLVYYPAEYLQNLESGIYFNRVGPQCSSAGFIYNKGFSYIKRFINRIKQILSKGEDVLRSHTLHEHLSEMIMIDVIHRYTKDINYFPLLPFEELINGFVFDGASYGQFLGGTNNGEGGKGWYGLHHYIGREIHNNNIKITFNKKPYVIYNDNKIPIFNLHIHSKRLQEFKLEIEQETTNINPFDFFEKIYCINLDRRPEKWEQCKKHFKELNIENRVERFSGIDYQNIEAVSPFYKGKYGCTHSHLELIRQAKQLGLKNILVFEDDVNPHLPPNEIHDLLRKSISELPEDWEIFYLSANPLHHPDSLHNYSKHLCMVKLAFTTHAIAINDTAYDHILNNVKTEEDIFNIVHDSVMKHINIDGYYMHVILPRCKSYLPRRLLFTQRDGTSDCDNRLAKIDKVIIKTYNELSLLEV